VLRPAPHVTFTQPNRDAATAVVTTVPVSYPPPTPHTPAAPKAPSTVGSGPGAGLGTGAGMGAPAARAGIVADTGTPAPATTDGAGGALTTAPVVMPPPTPVVEPTLPCTAKGDGYVNCPPTTTTQP
jgi:hypothetical protein